MMYQLILTFCVVLFAVFCFVSERFPADITAISVMVILMVLGLVSPEEGISGFSNPATVTVLAMFILGAGITRTGVVELISAQLARSYSKKIGSQILIMGAVVAPLSAFINNTAVVAVLIPVIEDWCRQRRISPSKLLMPLSYITILGGMITVIGTSTSVLASGMLVQLGYQPFGLFYFTQLGLLTCGAGILYLAWVAPRWLPNRCPAQPAQPLADYGLADYVSEIVIPAGSSLVGQTLQTSHLQRRYDLDVLELIRGDNYFLQPVADKPLQVGDTLLVRASRQSLLRIQAEKSVKLLPTVKFKQDGSEQYGLQDEEGVAEVLLLSTAAVIGSTLKEVRFRQRYNATVLAIRRGEEVLRDRLGKVTLRFGDVLLLQGPKQSLLGLQTQPGFLVTAKPEVEILRRERAGVAIAILCGVVLIAALEWLPILVSAWLGVILMLLTGCLKPGELYTAVRWDVIFLLAGLIPLGIAMENSGATQWLADSLANFGGRLSPYWLLTILFVLTSLITEILSNNACVVLLLPVAVKLAEALSLNPYAFMLTVTFAASNSFMTPIGYQTNTMVYGPGGYRFSDFIRVGGPLNLIMAIITPPLIIHIYGL